MKVRSQEELAAFVDNSLAWRRKEVSFAAGLVSSAREFQQEVLLRAATLLLYAHWEGFVKDGAVSYCAYVKNRRIGLGQLPRNFVAMVVRHQLKKTPSAKRIAPYMKIVDIATDKATEPIEFPVLAAIDTESNLTFELFEDIAMTLGLDVSKCATKAKGINERLVGTRNKIAHGERVRVDSEAFMEIRADTDLCMDIFRTEVQNAAVTGRYRAAG